MRAGNIAERRNHDEDHQAKSASNAAMSQSAGAKRRRNPLLDSYSLVTIAKCSDSVKKNKMDRCGGQIWPAALRLAPKVASDIVYTVCGAEGERSG
jgi:hypothetical protein